MREGSSLRGGERGMFFPAIERAKDRLVPAYLFGAAVVAPPETAQPPWLCRSRRYHFNCTFPKFLFCRP